MMLTGKKRLIPQLYTFFFLLASGVVPQPIKKGKEYPILVEKAEKTTVSSFTVGCSRRRSKKKLNRSWPEDNAQSRKCKGRAAEGD